MTSADDPKILRTVTNAKGSLYTKMEGALTVRLPDRWMIMRKVSDSWMVAFHHVASDQSVKFVIAQMEGPPMKAHHIYHVAMDIYRETFNIEPAKYGRVLHAAPGNTTMH